MPELPEVETIRRDLEREVVGRKIERVQVTGKRTVRRQTTRKFIASATGKTITKLRRKGKFLMIDLDGDATMAVHLRMSGQLLYQKKRLLLMKHTHARIQFEDDFELRFLDPRTFGELWVTTPDVPETSHMGPDAVNELHTPAELKQQFAKRKSGLKTLLLNQQVVAGIGNIYSDEILWLSKLRYDTTPEVLTNAAISKLHKGIKQVLDEAIQARGSSLSDAQYVDLYGQAGGAQRQHFVYDREGEECKRCGATIERVKVSGRSSYFCPKCQK